MITTYGPGRRNCRFDVVEIATLDEWPHALFPAHLLLCLDARPVSSDAIADLARRLIRGGLGAVLCHGPGLRAGARCLRARRVRAGAGGRARPGSRRGGDRVVARGRAVRRHAVLIRAVRSARRDRMPTVRTIVLVAEPDRARDAHRWLPVFCARR